MFLVFTWETALDVHAHANMFQLRQTVPCRLSEMSFGLPVLFFL